MAKDIGEWRFLQKLLPPGWEEAAVACGAFLRARFTKEPAQLLRLLLYHAVGDGSLRTTAAKAKAAGIASMSSVALFKRLKTAGPWLEWIASGLCRELREDPPCPGNLRLRAIDGTSISKPGSAGTDWRLHYMLDLRTLSCDWFELTDATGGEAISRAPVQANDVILGDRNFGKAADLRYVASRKAYSLVRIGWRHVAMYDAEDRRFHALEAASPLQVGEVDSWAVHLEATEDMPEISGRVVAVRLPAPLAEAAEKRARRRATRKGHTVRPETLRAAHFVFLFTTIPEDVLSKEAVLDVYRFRWQIEIAFKRHKQLLRLGRLPHSNPDTSRSWIMAKMVVALLLEKLHRNAGSFSPWGFRIEVPPPQPVP